MTTDREPAREDDAHPYDDACIGGFPFATGSWYGENGPASFDFGSDMIGSVSIDEDVKHMVPFASCAVPNEWSISWFGTRRSFDKSADVLQNDPQDPRWRCQKWTDNLSELIRMLHDSYSCDLSFVGMPIVILRRYEDRRIYIAQKSSRDGGAIFGISYWVEGDRCKSPSCQSCIAFDGHRANDKRPRVAARTGRKPYVYFIQSAHGGPVKIGHSTLPAARLITLQTGNPAVLRILATMIGGPVAERSIHRAFARDRIRSDGEWFNPSPELMAFIAEIASFEN